MNKDVRFGLKSSQTRSFVNRSKSRSKTPTKVPVSARVPTRKNPKDRSESRIGMGAHTDSTMTLRTAQRGREAKVGANKKNPIISSAEEETEVPVISYNYNPFRNQKSKLRQKSTSRYQEVEDDEGQSEGAQYGQLDQRGYPQDQMEPVDVHPLSTEPVLLREAGIPHQGFPGGGILETEPTFYPYPEFHDQRGYLPDDSDQGFPREVEPRYKQMGRSKPKAEELPLQRKKQKREPLNKGRAAPNKSRMQQQPLEQEQYGNFYQGRSTTSAANYNSGGVDEWGTGSAQYSSNSQNQAALSHQDMYRMMAPMFNQMMQDFVNKSRSTSPLGASPSPAPASSYSNVYQRQRSNSPLSYSQMHTPNPQKYPSRPSSYNNTMYSGFDQTPQASRQDVEDLKSQTALLSNQLQQFQKIIEDLKISVSEKDVEIFRLNLALGDEKKRSQNLTSQLRDPYLKSSRRNLDSFMDTPFGGVSSQHNLLSDDYVENEGPGGVGHSRTHSIHANGGVTSSHSLNLALPAKKVETSSTEVQTELEMYEEAIRAKEFEEAGEGYGKQSLNDLMNEINSLRAQLNQEREATEKERQVYEQQLQAQRNANTENIEVLETRANELSTEHSRYLESMRKQREQWADQRKRYELELREKGKTIGEMQRKIDKHSVDVQKAVKIHKANKELAESNLKLKADIKTAKDRWEKRGADQQSKIQYLEDSLASLKTSLRTSESRVCNNCAVHLQERDALEETFQAKKREIEAKKMVHDREQDQLLIQQKEYEEKLRNQPKELESKMAELEQKVEDERNQKLELEEQIKITSRDISDKDEVLQRIDQELGSVDQEYGKYEQRDKENQSVIDQVMERVAQANKMVEEQRATNKRLKQQLARDASNIVEMTTKEAELETQISNLSQELQGLEGLMPKKKH